MNFLKTLGFIHALPVTALSLFFVLPMLIGKQVRKIRFKDYTDEGVQLLVLCIPLEVVPGSWLDRHSKYWWGMSMGAFIIVRDVGRQLDRNKLARTIKHEQMHTMQQYALGIFQPIIYVICSVFIYIFMPNKHSYYDNPFERQARKFAGQQVNIPREEWSDPSDRWIWW